MSRDLVLRLLDRDRIAWSVIDRAGGERVAAGEASAGDDAEIAGRETIGRTICLIPSEALFLTRLTLPARSEREAHQAAPYMIEEELAGALAETRVVPGPRNEDGERWIAAADAADLAHLLDLFAPWLIKPVFTVPDSLAIAQADAALTLYDRRDCILFALAPGCAEPGKPAGGSIDPALFDAVIDPLTEQAGDGSIAATDALGLTGANVRLVPGADLDVSASAMSDWQLDLMPALFGQRWLSRLDLSSLVKSMRSVAALAAGLLVAAGLLLFGEATYFRMQAERFDEASVAVFRSAVPEVTRRVIPAEAERMLRSRIEGLGGGDASPFLTLVSALAELTDGNERVRIDHIRFDRSRAELSVSAVYTDFSDFDLLTAEAERLGLELRDGGAREADTGIQGDFVVRLR